MTDKKITKETILEAIAKTININDENINRYTFNVTITTDDFKTISWEYNDIAYCCCSSK